MLPRSLVKIEHSPSVGNDGSVEFDANDLLKRVENVIDVVVSKTSQPIASVAL